MAKEVRFGEADGPDVGLSASLGVEAPEASTNGLTPSQASLDISPQNISLVIDASGPGALSVPGGTFLQSATYIQEGPDLLLVGADGQTVLIRDYFLSESPADLISDNGARITGDLAVRLASYENPTQVAQATGTAPAQAIGQVDTLDGEAFATRTDGSRVSLGTGDPIFQGDLLETATGGSVAGLVFCPPAEHREPMSGLAIPFSMWQCAGHGDAAGPGFVR